METKTATGVVVGALVAVAAAVGVAEWASKPATIVWQKQTYTFTNEALGKRETPCPTARPDPIVLVAMLGGKMSGCVRHSGNCTFCVAPVAP